MDGRKEIPSIEILSEKKRNEEAKTRGERTMVERRKEERRTETQTEGRRREK